ncbi:sigma-54 interaction domain-containing protein [Caloramator proteoclasticus]|uniref:Transcriptional regulator containing PAS, AAA-type ATPase, and DNA-binding Fis domains n=1 Tax=Caloramator proteoclasticus DSM 10124 TaxID=1121262 RepID=A0A1M4WGV5_9CLOT|nr:sigma 54-interacting transcriptional regulator [Caloramator proteoclasticus]SHE80521.1 Transcriptional regulator containing PAS, AAA-type ATPase, and DNA-binding Fis domains [Caloramator proteoclasticus DSM 10124]
MNKLVIFSGTSSTKKEIVDQISTLLGDNLEISAYATDDDILYPISNSLVLVTSPLILDSVKPLIRENCKIIVARRTLNLSNLDKILYINPNENVLLVNDTYDTAIESIELLKNFGFDFINYTPYYPNSHIDTSNFKYAITPGEPHLVPHNIENVIDIGPRIIDITTIVEILSNLSMLNKKSHNISARYINKIISLSRELYTKNKNIKELNELLTRLINHIDDAIICFDGNLDMKFINNSARKLMQTEDYDDNLYKIKSFISNQKLIESILYLNGCEYIAIKELSYEPELSICILKNARERINIENKLRKEIKNRGYVAKYSFENIIHKSPVMKDLINISKKLSQSDFSILITGESGTGKELFASSIHNYSKRKNAPFLAINFASLPEEIIESELFGYEEGAFTGAKKGGKIGLFEIANGGTIFLDEIGDITPKIQLRLLRVLQEKEILKVGGSMPIPIDVRIIAATNKDLFTLVREGKFREDLYYRLKKLYIKLPPLRDRRDDILHLFNYFLDKKSEYPLEVSKEVKDILLSYNWPGNVRELENTVEYILAIIEDDVIKPHHLPEDLISTKRHCSLDDVEVFILKTIKDFNANRKIIGRKTLSELSFECGLNLSEQQIRSKLNILQQNGYIETSRGKVGIRLTSKANSII